MKSVALYTQFLAILSSALWAAPDNENRKAYLVPAEGESVVIKKIIGTNEWAGEYRMAGTPDGLAILRRSANEFSLFCTHAFPADAGAVRSHGARGAFISEWRLAIEGEPGDQDRAPRLLSGRDLIKQVYEWNEDKGYQRMDDPYAFDRLSSAHLAPASAFHFVDSDGNETGTMEPLLLSPEESYNSGRAFAHRVDGPHAGSSYVLPGFGRIRYEVLLPHPVAAPTTQVIAISDRNEGFVLLYVGRKRANGNPIERAGLVHGDLHVLVVEEGDSWEKGNGSARFSFQPVKGVRTRDFLEVDLALQTGEFYKFAGPKDGAWDPNEPSRFVLTTYGDGWGENRIPARVFELRFDSPDLLAGGHIQCVAKEENGHLLKLDNCEIDQTSRVWLQENPTKDKRLARLYSFTWDDNGKPADIRAIAHARPEYFHPGEGDSFITINEESCGIVSAEHVLGPGWFIVGMHSHVSLDSDDPTNLADARGRERLGVDLDGGKELVEDGQLMWLWAPPAQTRP